MRISKKTLMLMFGVFVFFLLWQWKSFHTAAGAGIDNSWVVSLNLIRSGHTYQWGKDYIFTYGPLYWLMLGIVEGFVSAKSLLFLQIAGNVVFAVMKTFVLFVFYRRINDDNRNSRLIFAAAALILVCLPPSIGVWGVGPDAMCLLVLLLLLHLLRTHMQANELRYWVLAALTFVFVFLLSIIQFIKFSYFNVAVIYLVLALLCFLWYKRYSLIAVMFGGYVAFSLTLWVLAGQSPLNLGGYIKYGLELSSGYTEAMSVSFAGWQQWRDFVFAMGIMIAYLWLLNALRKRDLFAAVSAFLVSPLMFLYFKESFVRADGHTQFILDIVPMISLYLLYVFLDALPEDKLVNNVNKGGVSRSLSRNLVLVVAALCLCLTIPSLKDRILPNNHMFEDYHLLNNYDLQVAANKAGLQNTYSWISSLLPAIGETETIDIFPTDISALYAYDLNYKPRFEPQSYSNYTADLDNATAVGFLDADAPGKLIYAHEAIDGRYAVFEEPAVFRTVLENYAPVAFNDSALLFAKSDKVLGEQYSVSYLTCAVGLPITIPQVENAYLYMCIDWKPSLIGKAANFLYKSPPNYISIETTDGKKREFRFIRNQAVNGLFVTSYVDNLSDLYAVFSGSASPNIENVTVRRNKWFYDSYFNVEFFAVPIDAGVNKTITVEFAEPVTPGMYQFFYANDNAFNGVQMLTKDLTETTNILEFTIPKGFESLRLDFPNASSTYSIARVLSDNKSESEVVIDLATDCQYDYGRETINVSTGDYDPHIVFHFEY